MAEQEEVLEQLKAEVEAMEGRETEVREKLMDVTHELEKYTTKLKENMHKIKHFQNEVDLQSCLLPSLPSLPPSLPPFLLTVHLPFPSDKETGCG